MLFCLCAKFLYWEEPECDAGKSGMSNQVNNLLGYLYFCAFRFFP